MRRRYRVDRFLQRLDQIREKLGRGTAFSTDVIVGFPGATEAEFQETLETCRRAQFMKVHVFPFSRRDGTPAATMDGQIPPEEIRRRVGILSDLERDLAEQFYRERIADSQPAVAQRLSQHPADLEVLAERLSEHRDGYVRGTDRWYMPVVVPGTAADLGLFVRCRGISASREGVVAERLQPLRSDSSLRHRGASVDSDTSIVSREAEAECDIGDLTACSVDGADGIVFVSPGIPTAAPKNSETGVVTWPS